MAESPVNMPNQELLAGLVNEDSVANINDVSAVAAVFGTQVVGRVNSQGFFVDINGDGVVNINDVSAVASNFGQISPMPCQ